MLKYLFKGTPKPSQSKYEFKMLFPFDKRKAEAEKVLTKHPDKVPIILEKSDCSDVDDVSKHKFLMPKDITVGQFLYIIRKNINDCFVQSPIKGIISKKYIETGEFALPASSLVKISRLDNVELIIYVSTEELGYVKPGMKADVTVDTFKDKIFPGKVIYISPEAEFTPRNIQTKDERTKLVFAVKIKIPNPDHELKPGMPADAVLHINK